MVNPNMPYAQELKPYLRGHLFLNCLRFKISDWEIADQGKGEHAFIKQVLKKLTNDVE